jgi:hypothetical protein
VDLPDLTPVLTAQGPFVTVHVGAESAVEQAADRYELAWKNVVKELEQLDVPEPVREAVHAARGEHSDGEARLVVASLATGSVLLAAPVSVRPATDQVSTGPLPQLLPLISDLSTRVPHVVVAADRTGADVSAWFDSEELADEVTVKGRTLHLKKVQVGGWAHHRYQHRTENQWRENAHEIRETAVALAEQIGAEIVIGVGDERELTFVREGLPQPWDSRWVEVPGGRTQDGSEHLVPQRVRDVVALHAARGTLDLLAEFAQERGQTKRACDGVEDVVAALRKAQVQTLLLTTDLDRSATLFFGADPMVLGTTREQVTALGAGEVQEGPLAEVLLRAALGSGAEVKVVPHEPATAPNGGVGAILRYADGDNAAARA